MREREREILQCEKRFHLCLTFAISINLHAISTIWTQNTVSFPEPHALIPPCSHTSMLWYHSILQKSLTVWGRGPWAAMYITLPSAPCNTHTHTLPHTIIGIIVTCIYVHTYIHTHTCIYGRVIYHASLSNMLAIKYAGCTCE